MVKRLAQSPTFKNARVKTKVIEQQDLDAGMQGALLDALPLCKAEPVLIIGSDIIDPAAYRSIRTRMQREKADGLLLARKVHRYFPGGYLTLKGSRITGITEKPGEGNEPSDLINIVAHAHRDASLLLKALRKTHTLCDDGYERALSALLKSHHYEAIPYSGQWYPVKYPWHLLELLASLLQQQRKSTHRTAHVHRTAVLEGPVILAEGVRVLPHASIIGPCFIGPHTIIGNNAFVRRSSIGAHCVIGFSCEVKGSALSDHVWAHSTYIGDSIIGENVSLGAGSVTGNLRFDEGEITSRVGGHRIPTGLRKFGTAIGSNVRIGIHTSINPGVKIGSGSFVSSAAVLSGDIPENAFVKMVPRDLFVRKNQAESPKPR